jgi:methanogenic corrinoid protein MtbC1
MDKDTEIFKGKSFSDIAKDLYSASKKKETQINLLISELKPFVQNIGDATIIVPLIKDYLEVGVKNDDQLAKLLAVVQRLIGNNAQGDNEFSISEEEKKQLLDELEAIEQSNKRLDEKVKSVEDGVPKSKIQQRDRS